MIENNESSYKTAITRRSISAPVKKLLRYGAINTNGRIKILDYGCGKGLDAEFLNCDRFDPYYFPSLIPNKKYDAILCTYVLNVTPESMQQKIIDNMVDLLENPGSPIYISVRRDIPKEGTPTQRWVELHWPFRRYQSYATFITYYANKQDLLEFKASEAARAVQGRGTEDN